jgi:uncharacterized protein (DUF302 family)
VSDHRNLGFEVELPLGLEAAIARVTDALKAESFGVLTRIDVDRTLREKLGVEFRPYAILGVCNPPLAHRALSHEPRAGLLLPCNVTVEESAPGRSIVRIGDPRVLFTAGGMGGDPVLGAVADEAREKLLRVVAALEAR